MAERLGMRREWFQDRRGFSYYDLPPFRREAALALGAIEHSLKDWLKGHPPLGSSLCSAARLPLAAGGEVDAVGEAVPSAARD